jgi:hypothetical protein
LEPVLREPRAREDDAVSAFEQIVEEIAGAVADRVVRALATEPVSTTASEWQLLSTEEVSTALNRSTRWVREKARSGELPWVRLDSGPLSFRLEDVQAFAASRRVPAGDGISLTNRLPDAYESASTNGSGADARLKEPGVERWPERL